MIGSGESFLPGLGLTSKQRERKAKEQGILRVGNTALIIVQNHQEVELALVLVQPHSLAKVRRFSSPSDQELHCEEVAATQGPVMPEAGLKARAGPRRFLKVRLSS